MANSKKAVAATLLDFAFIVFVGYALVKALYEMNGDYIIGTGVAILIIMHSRRFSR